MAAAIAPHGSLAVEQLCNQEELPLAAATRQAFAVLARRWEEARPEAVVMLTPHGVHVGGSFAVVGAGRCAGLVDEDGRVIRLDVEVALDLTGEVRESLQQAGLPVVTVSYGGNSPAEAVFPMDWGTLIPLWFLGGRWKPPLPVVVVSPARERPPAEHVRAGRALRQALLVSGRRVALVASADHGHAHLPDGPYGFDPAAREYDQLVVELIRSSALRQLEAIEPQLVERARADSWWQLLMLSGACGEDCRSELLSYEAPTYYGMAVAWVDPG